MIATPEVIDMVFGKTPRCARCGMDLIRHDIKRKGGEPVCIVAHILCMEDFEAEKKRGAA